MFGMRVILAGGLLALVTLSCAAAGPIEDGYDAARRGDYETAIRLFRPLADHGDVLMQIQIGSMYEGGYGVPQDFAMAHMWYNLAASRPSPGDDHLFRDEAVKFRDEIAAKMTPAQIAEAQRM